MVDFRPHILKAYISTTDDTIDPLTGDVVHGSSDVIEYECRATPNGAGLSINRMDGKNVVYGYLIHADAGEKEIPYGTKIQVFENGSLIAEGGSIEILGQSNERSNMGIKVKLIVNKSVLSDAMSMAIEKVKERLLDRFIAIGKTFKNVAKSEKEFQDHTYNLVSSIGFGIARNGTIIHEDFSGEGEEGIRKGKELIQKIASETQSISLICVAGENYAIMVESRGLDVITGSSFLVEKMLRESFS